MCVLCYFKKKYLFLQHIHPLPYTYIWSGIIKGAAQQHILLVLVVSWEQAVPFYPDFDFD